MLSVVADIDKSGRRISPEVLSTMTSRCDDDVSRRRRISVDAELSRSSPPATRRYPINTLDDQRSTGTGNSFNERHVTSGNDDVTRQTETTIGGTTATMHRRRRRTAFTNDQVETRQRN